MHTYSSSLLADTTSATGDEDDLASHVWYVLTFELGATSTEVVVDDGPQKSHVGYNAEKWSGRRGCVSS